MSRKTSEEEVLVLVAGVLQTDREHLDLESGPANEPAWDSLAHINILAAIEQATGLEFSMQEMLSVHSVGDLIELLNTNLALEQ